LKFLNLIKTNGERLPEDLYPQKTVHNAFFDRNFKEEEK
jgi:hypothetical protein